MILVLAGSLIAQQNANWNIEQTVVTVDISDNDTLVNIDLYELFGRKDGQELKLIGIMTDTVMTSTALTFNVYDENQEIYKNFEDEDGDSYTLTIEANKYYPLKPTYFAGFNKIQLQFGTAEEADREITLVARVY